MLCSECGQSFAPDDEEQEICVDCQRTEALEVCPELVSPIEGRLDEDDWDGLEDDEP